jgi:type IV pilus assembly protein PilE
MPVITGSRTWPSPRRPAGFTLIELLVALLVLAVLAAVAVPTYQGQVRKARRAEAIAGMLAIQQAQERWRAAHPSYAGRLGGDGLALPDRTASGRHALRTSVEDDTGSIAYTIEAQALSAGIDPCAHLRLEMHRGQFMQRSGADARVANGPADNRACWGL